MDTPLLIAPSLALQTASPHAPTPPRPSFWIASLTPQHDLHASRSFGDDIREPGHRPGAHRTRHGDRFP
jgi:hypothetical protein